MRLIFRYKYKHIMRLIFRWVPADYFWEWLLLSNDSDQAISRCRSSHAKSHLWRHKGKENQKKKRRKNLPENKNQISEFLVCFVCTLCFITLSFTLLCWLVTKAEEEHFEWNNSKHQSKCTRTKQQQQHHKSWRIFAWLEKEIFREACSLPTYAWVT